MIQTRNPRLKLQIPPPTDGWKDLQEVRLTIPGQPVPKARPRLGKNGNVYTPRQTVEAERRLADYLKVRYPNLRPTTEPVGIRMRFYLRGAVRTDLDNLIKAVLDGLQGCAFINDAQVEHIDAALSRECDQARTDILVYKLMPFPEAV